MILVPMVLVVIIEHLRKWFDRCGRALHKLHKDSILNHARSLSIVRISINQLVTRPEHSSAETATAAADRGLPTKIWRKIRHFQNLPDVCVCSMNVGFG
jgi:hypothetical protein